MGFFIIFNWLHSVLTLWPRKRLNVFVTVRSNICGLQYTKLGDFYLVSAVAHTQPIQSRIMCVLREQTE